MIAGLLPRAIPVGSELLALYKVGEARHMMPFFHDKIPFGAGWNLLLVIAGREYRCAIDTLTRCYLYEEDINAF